MERAGFWPRVHRLVPAVVASVGGWDAHSAQGTSTGQLATRLRRLSDRLAAVRTLFAELVERHLGNPNSGVVFPGFAYDATTRLGVIA